MRRGANRRFTYGYGKLEDVAGVVIVLITLSSACPEILSEIESAPVQVPGVRAVREARARWLGHCVHAELAIDVEPGLSLQAADAISRQV